MRRVVEATGHRRKAARFGSWSRRGASCIDDVRGTTQAHRRHALSVMAGRSLRWAWDEYRTRASGVRISCTVNGRAHCRGCLGRGEPADRAPPEAGASRLEERMRAGRMRILLRVYGRGARLRVPRARRPGRRTRDCHGRRVAGGGGAAPGAGGFCRSGCGAVWLLHPWPDSGDSRPSPPCARAHHDADPRGAGRQHLPLHRLRKDHRCGRAGCQKNGRAQRAR